MTTYRIELRSYNIGAGAVAGTSVGTGFAHNFLVLVKVPPVGEPVPVAEFHGHSFDPKSGKQDNFDALGGGRLTFVEETTKHWGGPKSRLFDDSNNHSKFILVEGSKEEVEARWKAAKPVGEWINRQDFTYHPLGKNSNSVIHTIARAMGFDVTGQPIDRKTGRHLPAPGGTNDLTEGRSGAPAPFTTKPERTFGYGDEGMKGVRPIPPDQEAPPYESPDRYMPRRAEDPAHGATAAFRLGFDNARRFTGEHGFDPRATELTREQNKIVSAWVLRELAPAIAHAQLPKPVGDDLLDLAAATTAHDAGLALQQGLNRLAGVGEFGRTPPAFADGAPMRVEEDGWVGPETQAALQRHRAAHGGETLPKAVSLAANGLRAAICLPLCAFALAGCFIFDDGPSGDSFVRGNLFDDAIRDSAVGSAKGVAERTRAGVTLLLGTSRSLDAVEALLTKHAATCRREATTVRCNRLKTLRSGMMGAGQLTEYRIELIAAPHVRRRLELAVCVDIPSDALNPHIRSCVLDTHE